MNIGYDTVIIVLMALIFVPILTFRPSTLLYLLVLMTMFPLYFRSDISIGHINIYSLDLITALYCLCAGFVVLVKYINKKRVFPIPDASKTLLYFILFYFVLHLAYLVAGLYQGVPIDSGIRRFLGFSGFFYFFLPILFIRNKEQLRNLLMFTLIIIVLFPAFQIYKFSIRTHFADIMTSSGTLRITSDGIPVIAAGLFMILIWNKKLRHYLLAACPLVSILFSGHRSAYLSIAISLMVLFYFQRKLSKPILFLFFTGFSLCIALIGAEMFTGHSFYGDAIKRSEDIFSSANVTTMARRYAISDNLFIFRQRPIFGIGYNEEILPKLFLRSNYTGRRASGRGDMGEVFNVLHPHNFLLRFLSNTGLMGTSVLFCIIFLVFKRCYALIRTKGDFHDVGVFLFCSIFFFLIFSLMNTNFFSEGYVFWILCGIAAVCSDELFNKETIPDEILSQGH